MLLIGEAWCHAAAAKNSRGTRSAKKSGVKESGDENEEVRREVEERGSARSEGLIYCLDLYVPFKGYNLPYVIEISYISSGFLMYLLTNLKKH